MYDYKILIRLQKTTAKILKEVAHARGEHISTFARRAIMNELAELGFLSDRENKALGIQGTSTQEPDLH